jgi:hypothetical protein
MEEMFNEHQKGHMRYLAGIPPEKKCWCGWYPLGECPHCPPGKTSADKMAIWCPECRTVPPHHVIGCSRRQES